MTSSLDSEYLIVVCAERQTDVHRIVPVPDWRPQLIDINDRDLVGFADDLIDTVVLIDVLKEDGTKAGYLIPTSARCALCHNQRHITVHRWTEQAPTREDDASTLTLYDGDHDGYSIYTRKPCPACRYGDYALSRYDQVDEEDQ
jgi:hypothetical protein